MPCADDNCSEPSFSSLGTRNGWGSEVRMRRYLKVVDRLRNLPCRMSDMPRAARRCSEPRFNNPGMSKGQAASRRSRGGRRLECGGT
eukprot:49932-Eustigmatos_ZCMA.PRE.1